MKCPKCQAENRDGIKFCEECGAMLEMVCASCGALIPPGKKFCGECGHKLSDSPSVPAIDYTQPQSYTPKPLAQKILTQRKQIEGERKLVTVFFSDVKGSTALHEKLDPEVMTGIIEGWYGIVMDEVHRYEGTITQFMGDGVMALFGAPVGHEDHARRACLAGLGIQERVKGYAEKVDAKHRIEFKTRVGLNSGLVIVTAVGDDLKMDYTALGDTVNLASRMETAAEPGTVLISENTWKLCRNYFKFAELGPLQVKGKSEPQQAFQVIATSDVATRIEASAARGFTRFVGRKKEIESLLDSFNKAKTGSGQVVSIVGEAGVGKSRLLYEFRNLLSPDEYHYLEGSCLQYGGTIIYKPILDILKSFFGIKEGESEETQKERLANKLLGLDEKLASALPPLQDLLSLTVDDEEVVGASSRSRSVGRDREVSPTIWAKLEPKVRREKTFEALRDFLTRLSQDRPLVLSIEDLHWMDKSSEEFLDFLIGSLAGARIMLILLYRPEYTHQWGSKTYYHKIALDQLPLDQCAELVRSILADVGQVQDCGAGILPASPSRLEARTTIGAGHASPLQGPKEVSAELQNLILSRAAGNPLFMEEMTHTLLENGSIKKEDHKYVLTRPASQIEVPDTVQGIIAARMDRLEESVKRTMQVAAVIGRDFAFRLLHAITDLREDLKSHLGRLQGLEFIYQKNLFPELEYIFKHALTQEVAYNSLLIQRRKELHLKIGQAIEQIYAERLDEFYEALAYHYDKAEDGEKAYDYYRKAGEKAMLNYSNWEGFRFLQSAISALKSLPESEAQLRRQAECFEMLHTPMLFLGYPEGSLQNLQEEKKLLGRIGEPDQLVRHLGVMGHCYAIKCEIDKAQEYCEESYREAKKTGDLNLIAIPGNALMITYSLTSNFSKLIQIGDELISLLRKAKKEPDIYEETGFNLYSIIHSWMGGAFFSTGNFLKGEAQIKHAIDFSKKFGSKKDLALGELFGGLLNLCKGDGIRGREHYLLSNALYSELDAPLMVSFTLSGIGLSYYLTGDLKVSIDYMEKSFGLMKQDFINKDLMYAWLSYPYLDSGDFQKAQGCLEKAMEISRQHKHKMGEGYALILMGRLTGKRDLAQAEKAEEFIRHGLELLRQGNYRPYASLGHYFLGELFCDLGRKAEARESLEQALSMMDEMGMMYWPEKARAVLGRLEA